MTTDQNAGNPMADAIKALTAAARQRRTIGAGTPNEHTEPVDFGEIACQVITSVAANLGGIEYLLAGRPGSWEADHVRGIVRSTAGGDERALIQYRTEPLRLVLDVDGEFGDFGIYDLYEEAADELMRRLEEARDGLLRTVATPAERARVADIQAVFTEWGLAIQGEARRAQASHLRDELEGILQSVDARAEKAGDPLYAELAAAEAADGRLAALWEQDQQQYREAYARAVRRYLKSQGMDFQVQVIDLLSDEASAVRDESRQLSYVMAELVDELHGHARKTAVLPMTGEAPDWAEGKPADALRRAGLTYVDRAAPDAVSSDEG